MTVHISKRAFTLIELVITIVIVGVLATTATVAYQQLQDRAHREAMWATMRSIEDEYRALAAMEPDRLRAEAVLETVADLPPADRTVIVTAADLFPDSAANVGIKVWGTFEDTNPASVNALALTCALSDTPNDCDPIGSPAEQPPVSDPAAPHPHGQGHLYVSPTPVGIYVADHRNGYRGCLSLGSSGPSSIMVQHHSEASLGSLVNCVMFGTL